MSDSTVYLITGAARGIGFELVKLYSADPSNVIIAGVRDTTSPTALLEVAKSSQAKIHLVKIVAGDEEGNKVAAKEVEGLVGRVDVLWANAGISETPKPVLQINHGDMQRHWETNTLGPLYLFQSFYPLLLKSTKAEKKFVITSTLAGSLTAAVPFPLTAYGSSKAAINFVGIHIHQEHAEKDKIAVVMVHPGMVSTDMGNVGIESFGGHEAVASFGVTILTPVQSATYVKEVADKATIESHGGKFFNYDGEGLPW